MHATRARACIRVRAPNRPGAAMRRILPLVLATVLAPIAAPASAQDYPT